MVWVHGGPGGQSRKGYRPLIQHLVNNGYTMLAVNNRGSSGYGKSFFHLDDKRHGDVDLKDCVKARGYLEGLRASLQIGQGGPDGVWAAMRRSAALHGRVIWVGSHLGRCFKSTF